MDYEKKLALAKEALDSGSYDKETIEYIFPELKESEGEKIRKALISFLKSPFVNESITDEKVTPWIAWLEKQGEHAKFCDSIQVGDKVTRNKDGVLVNLSQLNRVAKKDEKQGEQKPAEFDDTNAKRMFIKALERVEEQNNKGYKITDCDKNSWWEDFKAYTSCIVEQKPWSKEDESLRLRTIGALVTCKIGSPTKCVDEQINWLKSLRPQNRWKPSVEQIKQLGWVAEQNKDNLIGKELMTLYEELKKLKG